VGAAVEVWLGTSDGTNADGQLGTTTAALVTDKRNNLTPVGQLIVDQTTTNVAMTGSWNVYVPTRYATLALWNATALPLQTSTSVHKCSMTPTPLQQQAT
jgi:membrane carboxypeptidase/penicillin-binding protein PbpC